MTSRLSLSLHLLLTFAVLTGCQSSGGSTASDPPAPAGSAAVQAPRDDSSATGKPATAPAGSATAVRPNVTPTPSRRPPKLVSLAYLASNLSVPALPATFATPRPDQALQELIAKELEGEDDAYSVVVHHLADGRYAALNEAHVHYAASTFKLAVLAAAFRQRDAGKLPADRELVLEDRYAENDLGTMEPLGLEAGDRLTVADALKAMIVVSDTPTALMIEDAVGSAQVEALIRAEGLASTSVLTRDLPTTAQDMAHLMEVVASGKGFTPASRSEMLSLLMQEQIRGGIPSGVPAGTALAHKTGNYSNATHDIALVWGPTGPYVIAVLSDRAWDWAATVRISHAVYQYLSTPPTSPSPSPSPQPSPSPVESPAAQPPPASSPSLRPQPSSSPPPTPLLSPTPRPSSSAPPTAPLASSSPPQPAPSTRPVP